MRSVRSDTWKNVEDMWAALANESDTSPPIDFNSTNAPPEPDDPNKCPYNTVHEMIEHRKSQPEWMAWRAAPVEERKRLARQLIKQYHPDK